MILVAGAAGEVQRPEPGLCCLLLFCVSRYLCFVIVVFIQTTQLQTLFNLLV